MLKNILFLILIVNGLTVMSCSNSSKKINQEVNKELDSTKTASTDKSLTDKIIKRFERQGIKFSEDQLVQIKEIVDNMSSVGGSKENRNELKSKLKMEIDQNVLTEEQKGMLKKKGK